MSNLPDDFMFSQSSLQDFVDCPRRFELKYLLKQRYPAPEVDDMLAFEHRMEQGQQFHLAVHQHLIGIPASILQARLKDAEVAGWFATYLKNGLNGVPAQRYPEKTLTIPLGDYGLLAKIDLLAFDEERVQVIDWKTSRYIPRDNTLESRWQTRVYRYVVAKGAGYLLGKEGVAPDKIEMIYWYAAHDGATRRYTYSQAQMEQDEADLLQIIDDIDRSSTFPLTSDESRCRFCTYRSLCDRGETAGTFDEWDFSEDTGDETGLLDIDFDQIAEIEF